MRLAADIIHTIVLALAMAWAFASAGPAGAQTIADYSRSQRAVIESEIARNTAKAMAASSGAAAPSEMPAPGATPLQPPPPSSSILPNSPPVVRAGPPWTVSGVFLSPSKAVAEVVVDGAAYLLTEGQEVPGTPWRVQSVAADKVVIVTAKNPSSAKSRSSPVSTKVVRVPAVAP